MYASRLCACQTTLYLSLLSECAAIAAWPACSLRRGSVLMIKTHLQVWGDGELEQAARERQGVIDQVTRTGSYVRRRKPKNLITKANITAGAADSELGAAEAAGNGRRRWRGRHGGYAGARDARQGGAADEQAQRCDIHEAWPRLLSHVRWFSCSFWQSNASISQRERPMHTIRASAGHSIQHLVLKYVQHVLSVMRQGFLTQRNQPQPSSPPLNDDVACSCGHWSGRGARSCA